jgi:hypothetical protein
VVEGRIDHRAQSGSSRSAVSLGEAETAQNNLISRFTKMVSAIESTIDQTRQPGMKRTCVRSPDPFQITNIYGTMSLLAAATTSGSNSAREGSRQLRAAVSGRRSVPTT